MNRDIGPNESFIAAFRSVIGMICILALMCTIYNISALDYDARSPCRDSIHPVGGMMRKCDPTASGTLITTADGQAWQCTCPAGGAP